MRPGGDQTLKRNPSMTAKRAHGEGRREHVGARSLFGAVCAHVAFAFDVVTERHITTDQSAGARTA